jgi:hypothetical protein
VSPIPDDTTLVIHMGAGAVENLIDNMITFHDLYAGVIDLNGRFMVSVYATVFGVTQADITSVMPQKQFGTATFAAIAAAGLQLYPTTVEGLENTAIADLQPVHFDIEVPVTPRVAVGDLSEAEIEALKGELLDPAEQVLQLFTPRRQK